MNMQTGWAIDGVAGVGAQSGGGRLFSCPPDMVITGFAGGAWPTFVSSQLSAADCAAQRQKTFAVNHHGVPWFKGCLLSA
jgi:hypothetical protein